MHDRMINKNPVYLLALRQQEIAFCSCMGPVLPPPLHCIELQIIKELFKIEGGADMFHAAYDDCFLPTTPFKFGMMKNYEDKDPLGNNNMDPLDNNNTFLKVFDGDDVLKTIPEGNH